MDKDICTYCGSYAEHRDHVIPLSFLSISRSYDPSHNWITPACSDCNKFAGSKIFFSIPKKAEYILSRYRKRYKSIINMPEWSEDEMNSISEILKESIWSNMIAKRLLKEKMEFIETVINKNSQYLMPDFIKNRIIEFNAEMTRMELLRKNKLRSRKLNKKLSGAILGGN